jgi:hypothetical protein
MYSLGVEKPSYVFQLNFDLGTSGKSGSYELGAERLGGSWVIRIDPRLSNKPDGVMRVRSNDDVGVVTVEGLCPEPTESYPRYFVLPGSYTVDLLSDDRHTVLKSTELTTSGKHGGDAYEIEFAG